MKALIIILLLFPASLSAQLTVKKVIQCEYRTYYVYSDGDMHAYSNNGGTFIKNWGKPGGVTSWTFSKGAFNYAILLDQVGKYWRTKPFNQDNTDSWFQITTDSAGNSITGLFDIDSYSSAQCYIRASDSAIYYGGVDVYSRFYAGGSLVTSSGTTMSYTQLSPGGVHFKKVVMGGTMILGLTGDGLTLYKWTTGTGAPTTYSLPRPAIDVFVGSADFGGVLIPDATGAQNMGYPYVMGTSTSLYGGGSAFTTPTSIKAFWNMTMPIKVFNVSWQTIHYIDSTGVLWGCGWNSYGEVGNGQEFIGQYTYGGFPNMGWSLANGENPTGKPVKIGDSTKTNWTDIVACNWFGTCVTFKDANDSLWVCGRNKASITGQGYAGGIWGPDGSNLDQFHYNTMDVITPTQITPLSARTVSYNAAPPNTIASHNKKFVAGAITLIGSGPSLKVYAASPPAANGVDTICCNWSSFAWTKLSGPSTITFGSASAQTTTASGFQNGKYIFNIQFNDNHSGIDTAQVPLYVNRIRRIGPRIKWH